MKKHTTDLHNNQRGVVSIMITMIMLIVVTLIVIGFTQVANRNRQEALDRQLSSQAFYAAESGINTAVADLKNKKKNNQKMEPQTQCNDTKYPAAQLQSDPDIRVTCLLVNPNPDNIETTVSKNYATTVLIHPVEGTASPGLSNLTFAWRPESGQAFNNADCETNAGSWKPGYSNCSVGTLRVDLTHIPENNNVTPEALAAKTKTFYLRSMRSGATPAPTISAFDVGDRYFIVGASCTVENGDCRAQINLDGEAQTKRYYARLTMLYRDTSKLTIDGTLVNSSSAQFNGAQVVVDSTGKARDVLRRVQTRFSLGVNKDTSVPISAVGSGGTICKRFTVTGSEVKVDPTTPPSLCSE